MKSGGTAYGDVSSTEYGFQLAQKLSVAPRSEFEASLNYRHTAFDRSGNTSAGSTETPVPSGLQSITLGLSGRQQIADSWTAIVGSETGYHGTCGSVFTSKGLGVGVFALASRRFGPSLSLTGGIAYSSLASGFAEFLPVIGVEWQASPKWSVGLGFPKTGVTYHFSDKLRFSLVGEGMAGTYYIKKDPQPGARGRVALNDTKLEYYDVRMGLNAEWLLTGRLRATVTAGTVAMREFDYHQRHFKLKSDHHSHYGSAGVVVSF